jgi:hypothetical protein
MGAVAEFGTGLGGFSGNNVPVIVEQAASESAAPKAASPLALFGSIDFIIPADRALTRRVSFKHRFAATIRKDGVCANLAGLELRGFVRDDASGHRLFVPCVRRGKDLSSAPS